MQLPAVEFMPSKLFPASHQQAVSRWCQLSVPHLQLPSTCLKWQKTGHRMLLSLQVRQRFPQHQHSAAFGIDRSLTCPGHQVLQAAFALTELGRMLFGEAAGDDHATGLHRQRLIGERAPAQHRHSQTLQQLFRLGIAEMEGFI